MPVFWLQKQNGWNVPIVFRIRKRKRPTRNEIQAIVCKSCGTSLEGIQPESNVHHGDITALNLGIRAVRQEDGGENLDAFIPIIEKGTPYPLEEPKRKTFYTTDEKQGLIKIPVFEGMEELASQNEQQGVIEWPLPTGLPINTPIEVSFNYNESRTLKVISRVMNRKDIEPHTVELKRNKEPMIISQHDGDSLEEDWREDADIIPAAEDFLIRYGSYIREDIVDKMQKDIDKLRLALDNDEEINGRAAAHSITEAMFQRAGIASQLFLAERAVRGASPETVAHIEAAVEELKIAHDLNEDSSIVRALIRKT